jgi:integrase
MPYYDHKKSRWVGEIVLPERLSSGRFRRKRKEFNSRALARRWELDQDLPVQLRTPTISLMEMANTYLEDCRRRYSRQTYEEKRLVFRELLSSIHPDTPVVEIERSQIREHLNRIFDNGTGYGANKRRKNLVAAWNWAAANITGFPSYNPCLVQRYPEVRTPRYVPSEEDFWQVYDTEENPADKALLLAYLHTGARKSELFRLRWAEVDLNRRRLQLGTRKRRGGVLEYDWLPITNELAAELQALAETAEGEWVFPGPGGNSFTARRKWLIGLCKRAGVKQFGFHGIRHLTASILVAADVPLVDVQTVLRHKSISTTERYIHRLRSVRNSLDVLNGRRKVLSGVHIKEQKVCEPRIKPSSTFPKLTLVRPRIAVNE